MKTKKIPDQQLAGTTTMADEFLALLLELESLNHERLQQFGDEMKSKNRRSHIPNKTS